MLQRLLSCALLAGLATGLLMTALHAVYTVPLIMQAEVYEERTAHAHPAADQTHRDASHAAGIEHDHDGAWMPDGWVRTAMTLLTAMASTIGFALMLLAVAIFLCGDINAWSGLGFGLAGFAATSLATSIGLAPELPGAAGGDLLLRQTWWIGTAAATVAGLAAMVFAPNPVLKVLGLVVLVIPHVIGAPEAAAPLSPVPAELSALFAARSLVLQGVMWAVLGMTCGWLWQGLLRGRGRALPA